MTTRRQPSAELMRNLWVLARELAKTDKLNYCSAVSKKDFWFSSTVSLRYLLLINRFERPSSI